jgi:signal transduction histidine kinase
MQKKHKILIVDDNATNIAILEEVLAEEYYLRAAKSGDEALEILKSFRPDMVLLDIMMPGIDGYETCRRIRSNPTLDYIKVIMVSAKAMVEERLKGYEAGADDYLTKPFEEEELLAKVRVYLRLKSIEEIDQLKSNLLTLLSHETRTPLNGILQPLEMLVSDQTVDAAMQKMCLDLVARNAEQLHRLFEKVLKLCAMKAGKWDFKFEPTDLSEIIAKATAEVAALASKHEVQIDHQLEQASAAIDAKELKYVVTALLDNAIRFSPRGGRVIVGVSADAELLSVNVSDQGSGIEPSLIEHVFEEFNDADIIHHTEGQRLSLAIAQQVAIAHDGRINVISQKGSGTTFTVELPLIER